MRNCCHRFCGRQQSRRYSWSCRLLLLPLLLLLNLFSECRLCEECGAPRTHFINRPTFKDCNDVTRMTINMYRTVTNVVFKRKERGMGKLMRSCTKVAFAPADVSGGGRSVHLPQVLCHNCSLRAIGVSGGVSLQSTRLLH